MYIDEKFHLWVDTTFVVGWGLFDVGARKPILIKGEGDHTNLVRHAIHKYGQSCETESWVLLSSSRARICRHVSQGKR